MCACVRAHMSQKKTYMSWFSPSTKCTLMMETQVVRLRASALNTGLSHRPKKAYFRELFTSHTWEYKNPSQGLGRWFSD